MVPHDCAQPFTLKWTIRPVLKHTGYNNNNEDRKHAKEYNFWGLKNMLTNSRDIGMANQKEHAHFGEANAGATVGTRSVGVEEYKTEELSANGRRVVVLPSSGHS